MDKPNFLVSGTPHIRTAISGEMRDIILIFSLVPAVACAIIHFGFTALLLLSVAILSCYITDMFFSFIIFYSSVKLVVS